jgi:hypothetical protein
MRIANPGGVSRAALGQVLTRVLVNVSASALAIILTTLPLRQARPRRAMAALGKTITLLAVCIGISVAFGEEKTSSIGLVSLHIPEQPLIDALHLYSRQTGVQVMFETASALGHRSQAVEGELTPEAALRTLLADTDLKIRYSRSSAVTLAPASVPDPDEPPGALLQRWRRQGRHPRAAGRKRRRWRRGERNERPQGRRGRCARGRRRGRSGL